MFLFDLFRIGLACLFCLGLAACFLVWVCRFCFVWLLCLASPFTRNENIPPIRPCYLLTKRACFWSFLIVDHRVPGGRSVPGDP